MTSTQPRLPFVWNNPLELPPEYAKLREQAPITRVTTAAGDEAWLVVAYDQARRLFADDRLGRSHHDPANAPRISNSALLGGPRGDYATEREDHTKMRRLLTPAFSARRMTAMRGHVQELVDGLLDRMAGLERPVDLHAEFSLRLPVLVICELLGVPYEDRDRFRALSVDLGDFSDPHRSLQALEQFTEYTGELLRRKREHPAEDVYSDLAAADLPDGEAALLAAGLLFAGHETTVNRIDYGVLTLLANPDQLDALLRDPSLVEAAVEELLRVTVPGQGSGVTRYAHADIEIDGVTIRRGEAVLLSPHVANHDPAVFPDPDRFDIARESRSPHIAFGYGAHFCLGASLARVELQTVFGTLFQRFPTLRLAVPFEELRRRNDQLTGGLEALPVAW
ncbi:cytochrome P450 [Thermopolyspora sp. NPDC052614]|uniref:cytochrome P450 n=1 Tax=Thermopolyspora sp. NPDC052614 TaxID=3155682 RepID=UPI00343B8D5A